LAASSSVRGIPLVAWYEEHPLVAWYEEHLGVPVTEGYVVFPESRDTHWVPFKAGTDYWPVDKQAMVNFTVRDLDAMLEQLRSADVPVDEKIEDGEYGRFGWATDPEGNRIALATARALATGSSRNEKAAWVGGLLWGGEWVCLSLADLRQPDRAKRHRTRALACARRSSRATACRASTSWRARRPVALPALLLNAECVPEIVLTTRGTRVTETIA